MKRKAPPARELVVRVANNPTGPIAAVAAVGLAGYALTRKSIKDRLEDAWRRLTEGGGGTRPDLPQVPDAPTIPTPTTPPPVRFREPEPTTTTTTTPEPTIPPTLTTIKKPRETWVERTVDRVRGSTWFKEADFRFIPGTRIPYPSSTRFGIETGRAAGRAAVWTAAKAPEGFLRTGAWALSEGVGLVRGATGYKDTRDQARRDAALIAEVRDQAIEWADDLQSTRQKGLRTLWTGWTRYSDTMADAHAGRSPPPTRLYNPSQYLPGATNVPQATPGSSGPTTHSIVGSRSTSGGRTTFRGSVSIGDSQARSSTAKASANPNANRSLRRVKRK